MPVRSNPYFGSPNTYGSRGLAPMSRLTSGDSSVALPLAQAISGIINAKMYDPSQDPQAMQAAKTAAELKEKEDYQTVLRQQEANINDPTVPLGDIAGALTSYGHAKPEDAATAALLAGARRGQLPDQSMDEYLTSMDPFQAAARGSNVTFSASTFPTRKKQTNIMVDGQPQIAYAEDANGMTPVLNKSEVEGSMAQAMWESLNPEQQRQFIGANPAQVTPYTFQNPDGTTEILTGSQAVGRKGQIVNPTGSSDDLGLTTGVRSQQQEKMLNLQNFKNVLGLARKASQDAGPTAFGAAGNVRMAAQEAMQLVQNLGLISGSAAGDLDGTVQQVLMKAQQNGIALPGAGAYDPTLSDVRKIAIILPYVGAAALFGQKGRDISNDDVKRFVAFSGDPKAWLQSQQTFNGGLDLQEKLADMFLGQTQQSLGGAAASAAVPPPAGGGTVEPPKRRIRIDANGNVLP